MFGFPTQRKYIQAPIVLIVVMVTLELLKPDSISVLGFYPDLVLKGEIWRILSGQLLHTNLNHLLLNSAGVVLVWALHGEYYDEKRYTKLLVISLIVVGALLLIFADYTHYAGLSAVLHTLIVYGAIKDIYFKDKTGWLLLAGVLLKVAYENLYGASSSTIELIDASVAVEAHLIGAIVGVILSLPVFSRVLR